MLRISRNNNAEVFVFVFCSIFFFFVCSIPNVCDMHIHVTPFSEIIYKQNSKLFYRATPNSD